MTLGMYAANCIAGRLFEAGAVTSGVDNDCQWMSAMVVIALAAVAQFIEGVNSRYGAEDHFIPAFVLALIVGGNFFVYRTYKDLTDYRKEQ